MALDRGLPRQDLGQSAESAELTAIQTDTGRGAIFLTNYARPQNMGRLIALAHAVQPAVDIVLIDNSDGPSSNLPPLDLSGVELVRPGGNRGAGYRIELAASRDNAVIMSIDDDIFPTTQQIEALFRRQASEPDRVHGVWGENIARIPIGLGFKTHLGNKNREVDILNQLYVFTPAQARRAMALAARIGIADWSKVGMCEDILLSHAGTRRPACHNVGPLETCPSAHTPGIASWQRDGFYPYRTQIVRRLKAAGL